MTTLDSGFAGGPEAHRLPGGGLPPPRTPSGVHTPPRRTGGGGSSSAGRKAAAAKAAAAKAAAAKAAAAKAAAAKAAATKALIEKMRRSGLARIAKQEKARKIKLSRVERSSLLAREQMRIVAIARGRGFTRVEGHRFIQAKGGSISGLRSATRKGFFIKSPQSRKLVKEIRGVQTGEAGIITGDVGERLTGIERISSVTRREGKRLIQKKERGEELSPTEQAKLLSFQFFIPVQEALLGAIALPGFVADLVKNPKNIVKVPGKILSSIKTTGVEIKDLAKVSKTAAVARIGGELILFWGTGTAFKAVGKVSSKVANKIDPFLKRPTGGKLIIKTTAGRTTLIVGGSVKKLAEPLSKQARLAGKRVLAVSAQADRLVNLIRTKRVVRKPIPGEANLSPEIRRLLRRFDRGRITRNELIRLQREVPLLERSFFADPRGRFRPSRLGPKQKDASLKDFFKGDITFRASKPQILVFENVKIAKFPKNLKDVEKALKIGKTLSTSQARRLLAFQTKKGGKFKPIGALTKEPEITLAPGEIIKKVKAVGTVLINGRRIQIVEAKVVKPKPATKKLIQKAKAGKITSKELKTLRGKLKKETGFNPLMGRRRGKPRPRARLPKRILARPPKRIPKKTGILPLPIRIERPPRKARVPKRPTKRPPRGTPRPLRKARAPKRPTKAPPRKPRVPKRPPRPPIVPPRGRIKKRRKISRRKKPQQSYKVLVRPLKKRKGQKRPKLIKASKVPLKKSVAKDLRNFLADTSLARTARIKKTKGKPKRPRLKAPKGYAKKTTKKFRRHRIVKGKRKPLPKGKVIERSRNLLDTRQEKRKIGVRKRIKQITRKPVKRKVTKRKAPRRKVFKLRRTKKSMKRRGKK